MREPDSPRRADLSLVTGIVCATLVVALGATIAWAALQRGASLSVPLPVAILAGAWVWLVYLVLIAWPLPQPPSADPDLRPRGQRGRAAKRRWKEHQRRRASGAFVLWCVVVAAYLLARPHARALEADGPLLCFAVAVLVPASFCTLYLVMRAAISRRAERSQDNHEHQENERRD